MADEKTCPHCGKPVPPTALGGICPECMLKAGIATQTEGPDATGPHGTKVIHPPPAPAEIATLFPHLEILECLGRGGMGVVYKARQPRLNRLVALKILAREREQDAQFTERFTREAQALARLSHANIVTVHDFGEAGGHCYLVMEFVDGLNLRQLLQTGKMKPEQALTIVPKICEALQYAHEQGIVHRDIKPENILLDKQGRVKIADFGIAKMLGDDPGQQALTGAQDAVGTPHYMAPEQIEKPLTVDHRADIYSLGVVFYEMLTGELPLGKFQPPSKKVQIDVRLDEVVLHALEKEPERRYQQASQVKTAVETITAASPGGRANSNESVQTAAQIEAARKRLKIPARGLIAAAVFQLLFALGLLIFAVPAVARENNSLVAYAVIGFTAVGFLIPTAVVLAGAINMLNLRRYTLTVVASVIAAVAGPGAILGLPFGVWACVELFRPDVRSAFAISRSPIPPVAAPDPGKMNLARAQVKGPAMGLIFTGVLDWVLFAGVLMFVSLGILDVVQRHQHGLRLPGVVLAGICFLAMALSGCIIYAGLKFMQLERRGWVMFGSVLAMLVSPGNVVGLPLGIWALVVLNRRDVREAFVANRQNGNRTIPASGVPLFPASGGLVFRSRAALNLARAGWVLGCLGALGFLGSIPGWAWLKGMFGFAGFFGLIGFAVAIELIHRRRNGNAAMPAAAAKSSRCSRPVRFGGAWSFAAFVFVLILSYELSRTVVSHLLASRSQPVKSDYIGQTWFPFGDSIEITSVDRAKNQMTVRGRYSLVSHDKAELALYITTMTNIAIPVGPKERMQISKGRGDFELIDPHPVPGLSHVSMYADGHPFASLYFGTQAEALEESKAIWITNETPGSATTDQILVEHAAMHVLAAIRDKDDAALKELATDERVQGWRDALPEFAFELREKFHQFTGKPFDLHVSELQVRGDEALVKCDGPAELSGKYLALFFVKTTDGWENCYLHSASLPSQPLDIRWKEFPGEKIPAATETNAENAVVAAAEKWLALVDAGNYSESRREASAFFRGAVTEPAWENSMDAFRKPLGDLLSRKLKSAQAATELPGSPDGHYVVMQFETSFANKKSATETVTFMLEKDGQWRAAGYYIK